MGIKCHSTPPTDRGVTNTLNSEFVLDSKGEKLVLISEVVIDWFQVTIFPKKNDKKMEKIILGKDYNFTEKIIPVLFYNLFKINPNEVIKEITGVNGYDVRYSYKGIDIMLNSTRDDMGINILLKGQGCRDFEELGISWQSLFDKLIQFDINFNRIDIAIDRFDKKYFNLELLKKYVKKGLCISKFKKSLGLCMRNLNDGSIASNTLQFGSKASDLEITFYDKYLERINAGKEILEDVEAWIRTELRFRHYKAEQLFYKIYNKESYMSLIKSILYNYIDFKVLYSKDKNISRRSTVKWWLNFLEDTEKLELTSRSSERRITKIHNWLLNMTSKSQLMVYISKLHNINFDVIAQDLIYELLVKGSEKITDKDLQIINDYRIANNMIPISRREILDYIQDLKDNILI